MVRLLALLLLLAAPVAADGPTGALFIDGEYVADWCDVEYRLDTREVHVRTTGCEQDRVFKDSFEG